MPRNAAAFEVDKDDPRANEPGAFYFMQHHITHEKIGIIHGCPCGCKMQSAMWFEGTAHLHAGGPEWKVTGDWPKVTLSPSIGIRPLTNGVYHWHGFLEDGVFVER